MLKLKWALPRSPVVRRMSVYLSVVHRLSVCCPSSVCLLSMVCLSICLLSIVCLFSIVCLSICLLSIVCLSVVHRLSVYLSAVHRLSVFLLSIVCLSICLLSSSICLLSIVLLTSVYLSVVHRLTDKCLSVCKLFTFSSPGPISTWHKTSLVVGIQFFFRWIVRPIPRRDHNKIAKIHRRNFKTFFSTTTGPISNKIGSKYPWVKGVQVCSNELSVLVPGEIITK